MGRRCGGVFRCTPRWRTPAPAKPGAAAPAPAPQSNGGAMGGGLFAEGMTWGFSNRLGHRFVDFFAGPRTVQVVEAPPPPSEAPAAADACDIQSQAFAACINQNGSDISRCQYYLDMLNHCRRGSVGGLAAATTIA